MLGLDPADGGSVGLQPDSSEDPTWDWGPLATILGWLPWVDICTQPTWCPVACSRTPWAGASIHAVSSAWTSSFLE